MVFFTYDDYCKNKRNFFNAISLVCEDSASYSYDSVKDVHDKLYRDFLSNKLEFSIIAYILATDKCKNKQELYDVLNRLSTIVTNTERKQSFQRLITYIFKEFFDENECEELLNKFKEGTDVTMKYAWDYVKEDIAREKARDKKEAFNNGFSNGISNVIKKMLQSGESMDKIKLYSGFTTKKIEKIKKEMNLAL